MNWRKIVSDFLNPKKPEYFLISGYLFIVLIGSVLLRLPSSQSVPTSYLDCLFMATSALSTTGLVSVSTSDSFTFFGEFVLLLLMQAGGIGYMAAGSFIIFGIKKRLSERSIQLIQIDYHLPASIQPVSFIRRIVLFTFVIECLGALLLSLIFAAAETPQPVWNAIFHSVSAFCTAGFSLFNNSFEDFYANVPLNLVIGTLSFIGAMGFIVLHDFFLSWTKREHRVTNTTKAILVSTTILFVFAHTVLIWTDTTINLLAPGNKILAAFFQSMTSMTTVGFNTIPIHNLVPSSLFLLILIMIIGASPTGTGGGIKSTTVAALLTQVVSALRGREPILFGKKIPQETLSLAVCNMFFYISFLSLGIFLLMHTEAKTEPLKIIFEAVSAIGTVGLSMGITPALTGLGKVVVIFLMFFGRVGPLSLGMALFTQKRVPKGKKEEESSETSHEKLVI